MLRQPLLPEVIIFIKNSKNRQKSWKIVEKSFYHLCLGHLAVGIITLRRIKHPHSRHLLLMGEKLLQPKQISYLRLALSVCKVFCMASINFITHLFF